MYQYGLSAIPKQFQKVFQLIRDHAVVDKRTSQSVSAAHKKYMPLSHFVLSEYVMSIKKDEIRISTEDCLTFGSSNNLHAPPGPTAMTHYTHGLSRRIAQNKRTYKGFTLEQCL